MQPRQKLMVRLYILLSIVKTEFTKPDYALQVITVDSRGKKKGLIMKIAIYSFLVPILLLSQKNLDTDMQYLNEQMEAYGPRNTP
jgi:hypothetical protein